MIDASQLLGKAELALRPYAVSFAFPEPQRMDVVVTPEHLKMAVRLLHTIHWGYLAALTGLDFPPLPDAPADQGFVEGLYHFCEGPAVLTLRVRVPYTHAEVDSICDVIPSATLYEREFMELFGVKVRNTPSTTHLLLDDDWPEGVYPMRKSFTGLPAAAAPAEGHE